MTNTTYAAGATSVILTFRAFVAATGLPKTDLAFNTASLNAEYTRITSGSATSTTITPVTATAGTWTSSGLVARNAANGEYELHAPNNALLTGADRVDFSVWDGAGTPTYVCTMMSVELTGSNPRTADLTASDIANAVVEAEIDALETYNRSSNTAATITGPINGATTLTITTDATYQPIKSIA